MLVDSHPSQLTMSNTMSNFETLDMAYNFVAAPFELPVFYLFVYVEILVTALE